MDSKYLILLAAGVILTLIYEPVSTIRGIRNHNPGNIRENDRVDYDWEGEAYTDSDGEFEEFVSPEYGIRAIARILNSYASRGVITMGDIISTWAPRNENNTDSYISHVHQMTGIAPNDVVTKLDYPHLIAAIIRHENGVNPYSMELINTGIALA